MWRRLAPAMILTTSLHPSLHQRRHRGKHGGVKHWLRSRQHGFSLPSILLANVQSLNNKLDDLHVFISFQQDIRN